MFGLGSSLRFYSPRPSHPFASVIEEWILFEVSLYGVRPTARLWAEGTASDRKGMREENAKRQQVNYDIRSGRTTVMAQSSATGQAAFHDQRFSS
jgi:hypothetical protein